MASTGSENTGESKKPDSKNKSAKVEANSGVVDLDKVPVAKKSETKTPRIVIPTSPHYDEYLDQEESNDQDAVIGFNFINYMYKRFKFADGIF